MSVGEANGIPFTLRDLEGICTAFDALGLHGRCPIKFGHNESQDLTDGQPALGWIGRVYVENDRLKADFTDMPTSVYELVQSGAYKFLSVELLKNVTAGTRVIPWVLDAVALLGADQPAFGNLKDLQSLTLKRKPVLQARARVAFKRAATKFSTGAQKGMDKAEVDAAIAAAVASALDAQEKKLTTSFTALLTAETKKANDAADAKVAKAAAEAHRAQIKAKFETAVNAKALIPAKRESFYKFNRVDSDQVIDIKIEDVDAYIAEFSDPVKLAAANKTQTKVGDKVEFAATAALEVTRRAEETAIKRGGKPNVFADMHAATKLVLSADPKLAKAYFADPNGAFQGEAA